MPDAPSRPMFPELLDEGLEPFEVPNLWLAMNEPDTYVDITETLDAKLAVARRARLPGTPSGATWLRPGTSRSAWGAERITATPYAEGFKAFRLVDEDEDEEA